MNIIYRFQLAIETNYYWVRMCALVLAFLFPIHCNGSIPRFATPLIFTSSYNNYYFKIIPNSSVASEGGTGYMYKVAEEEDQLLYQTSGWFSFKVLISADGKHIARFGGDRGLFLPMEKVLAVAFYEQGKRIKQYYISELIVNDSCIVPSNFNYKWIKETEWQQHKGVVVLKITVLDGYTILFDIKTGELVKREKISDDCI